MDENYTHSISIKLFVAILIVALFDLAFINWWVLTKNSNNVSDMPAQPVSQVSPSPFVKTDDEDTEKTKLNDSTVVFSSPSPTPTSENKPPDSKVVIQNQYREIFIPIGGGKTNSTSFADIDGAEVSIDTSKYSDIDYVLFEGSIWVDGGNGRAWAQLKNVSDNNPLIESQISNPTATPTLKSSAKVPLAAGSKTYRIQARTDLGDYSAHIDNGRLKIVLK